mgnify:CR=1 FL=1
MLPQAPLDAPLPLLYTFAVLRDVCTTRCTERLLGHRRAAQAEAQQAKAQQEEKSLRIEDGWDYFVIGWSQVIADVFDVAIPTQGQLFGELSRVAGEAR